jgi:uncharacterized protein (DUF2252 family)
MNIVESTEAYEAWLRKELRGDVVEKDLDEKHVKMAASPFQFLRATYWRWAETVEAFCPQFDDLPKVLAVGDIHLENYGVWRDADGRLVWGVNDFDEAAEMAYILDPIRLAASAVLARARAALSTPAICAAVTAGYAEGLSKPAPYVLDRDHPELRRRFTVSEQERAEFWAKIEKRRAKAKGKQQQPKSRYRAVLRKAMPEPVAELEFWRRSAGAGSLGRPRWDAYAEWRGGPVLREAKALVTSAWSRARGDDNAPIRASEIAGGRYRAPDPWYLIPGDIVVRRLSANSRKLTVKKSRSQLLTPVMLRAMAHDLASVHAATGDATTLKADFAKQRRRFRAAVDTAVALVAADQRDWAKHWRKQMRAAA